MFNSLLLLLAVSNEISAASTYRSEELPPVVLELPAELIVSDGDHRMEYPQEDPGRKEVEKREVDDDLAEFVLRVNPVIPRNPMSLKNFTELNCVGKKSWCEEEPTSPPPLCPSPDTPPTRPTCCGPSKPSGNCPKGTTIPAIRRFDFPEPQDPCDECTTLPPCSSTPFKACQSVPPPTKPEKLVYCSPTMVAMHPPCTYMTVGERSTKPLPTCNNNNNNNNNNKAISQEAKGRRKVADVKPALERTRGSANWPRPGDERTADDQYYILVKRSSRRKREYRPLVLLSPAGAQPGRLLPGHQELAGRVTDGGLKSIY